MAGSYPDVPGRRMAWDADGTVVVTQKTEGAPAIPTTVWEAVTPTQAGILNSEANNSTLSTGNTEARWLAFIFPELRELDGYFIGSTGGTSYGTSSKIEDSPDTTSGHDGTFDSVAAGSGIADVSHLPYAYYRDEITSLARNAKRAVRIKLHISGNSWQLAAVHLYGTISPGETPDRLLWLDEATGLEFTAALDLGDVPRGGSEDVELRLKNNSATYTINTIQYTAEDLYLGGGAWWTFTLPAGATFQATRQIASLAADTTTGVITARRITPVAATLGPHAPRFKTSHSSLT